MKILGIETSCDETGAAIIEANPGDKTVKILSNVVTSSLNLHSKTGGIIPEVAAREQVKYIIPVITKALKDSNLYPLPSKFNHLSSTFYRPRIDAIAVTVGPGLIGSLLVGVETARTLSYVWQKPIIPVNHLIGHIYANFVGESSKFKVQSSKFAAEEISFPAIGLIVSGGHTDLVLMTKHGAIKWLGGTRDDAAGEAFDKIGRLLGLPYPGGPAIEKASERGDASRFTFPRPMIDSNDFDFSFSGLKTAVLRELQGARTYSSSKSVHPLPFPLPSRERVRVRGKTQTVKKLSDKKIADICASVQQAIIDVLISKTLKAAQKYKVKSILLGGGVAANESLRNQFKVSCEAGSRFARQSSKFKVKFFAPPKNLCTDNAAMIASAAFFNYKEIPWQKIKADPELYFN